MPEPARPHPAASLEKPRVSPRQWAKPEPSRKELESPEGSVAQRHESLPKQWAKPERDVKRSSHRTAQSLSDSRHFTPGNTRELWRRRNGPQGSGAEVGERSLYEADLAAGPHEALQQKAQAVPYPAFQTKAATRTVPPGT